MEALLENLRFEVLIGVRMIIAFGIVSCRWLPVFQWKVGNHLQDCTASQPKRTQPTENVLMHA
jgi:hypothetical protein